jgi:hypothetical protein
MRWRRAARLRPGVSPEASGFFGRCAHAISPPTRTWKELVEVRRGDGEELDALQQRQVVAQRFVEHALVELDPGEFAVEKGVGMLDENFRCSEFHMMDSWSMPSVVFVDDDGEAEDLFEEVGLGIHGEAFDGGVGEAGEARRSLPGSRRISICVDALGVGAFEGVGHAEDGGEF